MLAQPSPLQRQGAPPDRFPKKLGSFAPTAGLEPVDALTAEPSLQGYHLLPGTRGDLLVKLGRLDEARAEFERAASLTRNARKRELLLERARACAGGAS